MPKFIIENDEYAESSAVQHDANFILSNDTALEEESDEYQRGYMHALSIQQRQYSLRNINVPINPIQKRKEGPASKNEPPVARNKGKEVVDPMPKKSPSTNERFNQPIVPKDKAEKKEVPAKEVEKTSTFSLENEISKLKVSIPLIELMKNNSYRGQVSKILNFDPMSDMVSVEDDQPELIFGPALNGESTDSDVPHFYISLRLHEFVLHNAMFDSGASRNLMPKAIMEKLGLDVTRKYHDLYSFDSNRVRCIGLIKDLVEVESYSFIETFFSAFNIAILSFKFSSTLMEIFCISSKVAGSLSLN